MNPYYEGYRRPEESAHREHLRTCCIGTHNLDQDRAKLAEQIRSAPPESIQGLAAALGAGTVEPLDIIRDMLEAEEAVAGGRVQLLFRLARVGFMAMYERGFDTHNGSTDGIAP